MLNILWYEQDYSPDATDRSMGFIRKFGRRSRTQSYAKQREIAEKGAVPERISLAADTKTNREILYYLAEKDTEPKVRQAVADNEAMPPHVSPLLSMDPSQDVRLALAGRLVELLPDVSTDEQSQLYAFVVQALGTLALDEVLKIRKALSSALKDHAYTPPKLAGQLARDVEREVSEPILRFCAALSDEDLLDILGGHPSGWVVRAIADRKQVSAKVSEAVIDTQDVPGGTILIRNEGANLAEDLLSYIVEKARSFPEWQKPMALRKSLPGSIVRSLAEFVDNSVRDLLLSRDDFDAETTDEVAAIFRRRVDLATDEAEQPSVEERLQKALSAGTLNEDLITDAVGMRDYDMAYGALAHLSGASLSKVEAIFDTRSAKAIVALSWKAELSMRTALQLQKEVAHIRHKDLLYPKDGTDYPMAEYEIKQHLEMLGVRV